MTFPSRPWRAALRVACMMAAIASGAGCRLTPERVLDLGETWDPVEQYDALQQLSDVAGDAEQPIEVRCWAARTMAHLRRPEAIAPLVDLYRSSPSAKLKYWVAWSLADAATWGIGPDDARRAVDALIDAAGQTKDGERAGMALTGMARFSVLLKGDDALETKVLDTVLDVGTRFPSLHDTCGCMLQSLVTADALLDILRESCAAGNGEKAFQVVRLLGRLLLEHRRDVAEAEYSAAVEELGKLIGNGKVERAVRLRALWLLGRLCDAAVAESLATVGKEDEDAMVRLMALWALRRCSPRKLGTIGSLPASTFPVDAATWSVAHQQAAALGEPDLEVQRFLSEYGMRTDENKEEPQ